MKKTYEEWLEASTPPPSEYDHPAKAALCGADITAKRVSEVAGLSYTNVKQSLGGFRAPSPRVRAAISFLLQEAGWTVERIEAMWAEPAPRRPRAKKVST